MESPVTGIIVGGAITLVVGLILLVAEYRTHWFANYLPKIRSRVSRSTNAQDWTDIIFKVTNNLAKIHRIKKSNIEVKSWEVREENKKIRLEVTMHKPEFGRISSLTKGDYIVWADSKGNVLHVRSAYASLDKDNLIWK